MEKIDMDEIYKKIENLCIKLKRNVNKKDITKENGFNYSYTTYMNAGLRLRDFPFFEILYNESPKLCLRCNNKILYSKRENVYCSSSCSASENNKKRKNGRVKSKSCPYCNKEFKNNQKKFCSKKCSDLYRLNENYSLWLENKLPKNKGCDKNKTIKKISNLRKWV